MLDDVSLPQLATAAGIALGSLVFYLATRMRVSRDDGDAASHRRGADELARELIATMRALTEASKDLRSAVSALRNELEITRAIAGAKAKDRD